MILVLTTYRDAQLALLTELPDDVNSVTITSLFNSTCINYSHEPLDKDIDPAMGLWHRLQHGGRRSYLDIKGAWCLAAYDVSRLTSIGFLHQLPGMESLKTQYPGVVFVIGIDLVASAEKKAVPKIEF